MAKRYVQGCIEVVMLDDRMTLESLIAELFFDGSDAAGAGALVRYVSAARGRLATWDISDGLRALGFPEPGGFLDGA